ncbi:MAG TPA: Hsp20/alpha crystallin family protein [Casimicrobiaceae bacterium]|nr:Hsp20/alpha crystallin family protein [Casimicrobiaceae bacterium]
MANITRYDPFRDLVRFDPLGAFDDFWLSPPGRSLWKGLPEEAQIKVDVREDERTYRVKADVPGVKKEDIKVSIDGNQVSISAEVKGEKEEKKGETVIRTERYYGGQYRSFTLPHDVDDGKAEAKCQDGVLELTLPKKEGGRSRQVTVK